MSNWAIGVFTSIDDGLGVHWDVLRQLEISTVHLHAPSRAWRSGERAKDVRRQLHELGIQVTAVFGGFAGESYADIPTTQRTIGLVPPETRAARTAEMLEIIQFASAIGSSVAALHLGFICRPEDDTHEYQALVEVTRSLCDDCSRRDMALHLETGQETADHLVHFLDDVSRSNLFVNFDPANMILYGTGEPLAAARQLGSRIRSVHCKDARWAEHPGQEWGQEVPLGQGDVDLESFLRTLHGIGYLGPLTIEREIPHLPEQQLEEIGGAVRLLTQLRQKNPIRRQVAWASSTSPSAEMPSTTPRSNDYALLLVPSIKHRSTGTRMRPISSRAFSSPGSRVCS